MSYDYLLLSTIDTMLDQELSDAAITSAHMLANRYFD